MFGLSSQTVSRLAKKEVFDALYVFEQNTTMSCGRHIEHGRRDGVLQSMGAMV